MVKDWSIAHISMSLIVIKKKKIACFYIPISLFIQTYFARLHFFMQLAFRNHQPRFISIIRSFTNTSSPPFASIPGTVLLEIRVGWLLFLAFYIIFRSYPYNKRTPTINILIVLPLPYSLTVRIRHDYLQTGDYFHYPLFFDAPAMIITGYYSLECCQIP